jgi:hypothetical protein
VQRGVAALSNLTCSESVCMFASFRFSLVCLQSCSQVLTWFKDANYERPQDRKLMIDQCFAMFYLLLVRVKH